MSGECEPWNNGYERDGETEVLLRKLQLGPLTDDQVIRSCFKEVDSVLSPEERDEVASKMTGGAAGLLAFDLTGMSEAVAWWEQKRRHVQETIDWAKVPRHLRELSERRARYILEYACGHGWAERVEDEMTWRITRSGRKLLDEGGFHMR